jgi:hypothetical protein
MLDCLEDNMNEDELKLYNSFKNATPEQQNRFTKDDWDEAERLSGLYKSQPTKVDEGTTVQGGVVFLNPTTEEKATKYARENPEQDTYKVDPSAGRSAGGLNQQEYNLGPRTQTMYSAARNALAEYVGGPLSSYFTKPNEAEVDDYGNTINPGETYLESIGRSLPENINKGKLGEGLAGALSDPINATMFMPGVGELVQAGKLGKAGVYLAEHPALAKGISSGIEGGGYTGLSQALDPNKDYSAGEIALGAGLGGLLGAGGQALKNDAKESFPGIYSSTSRAIDDNARKNLINNLDDILRPGIWPKNRAGFRRMADDQTAVIGEAYDKGIASATPRSFHSGPDELSSAMSPTHAYHEFGLGDFDKVSEGLPMLTPISEIEDAVGNIYKDKLAQGDLLNPKNIKKLDKSIETAKESAIHRQGLKEYVSARMPDEDLPLIKGEDPLGRTEILDKLLSDPVYEARDLSTLRKNMMKPNMYKKLDKGSGGLADRELSTSYRDAINDILESDPRYSEFVTPEIKKNYALYKSLSNVVDKPGAIGLADRLPWGQSVDQWRSASLKYKLGELLNSGKKTVPTLMSGESRIRRNLEEK